MPEPAANRCLLSTYSLPALFCTEAEWAGSDTRNWVSFVVKVCCCLL